MPELPEVETMRRGIAGIAGSRIEEVRQPPLRVRPMTVRPEFAAFRRGAVGRTVAAVGRAGKRVVLELDDGARIVLEPRMTGRIQLAEPADRDHLRLVFDLAGGSDRQLFFWDSRGLGVAQLLGADEYVRLLGLDRLGPDALEIALDDLRARLAASRRAIKVALLDQRAVAGVGNIYASEILHRARVHPELACCRLRPGDWRAVHAAMLEVLAEAVRYEGSTLRDGMYATATNHSGGFQLLHRVYQRHGQACLQCGRGRIRRVVQAQRSSFYCPLCQRRRGK